MTFDTDKLAFEQIAVQRSSLGFNLIDIHEFLAIPLDQRIALIVEKKVKFLAGSEIVSTLAALRSIEAAKKPR